MCCILGVSSALVTSVKMMNVIDCQCVLYFRCEFSFSYLGEDDECDHLSMCVVFWCEFSIRYLGEDDECDHLSMCLDASSALVTLVKMREDKRLTSPSCQTGILMPLS